MRGQGASEFLLVVAILLTVILAVVVPALSEIEASFALAAARSGGTAYCAKSGLELSSLGVVDEKGTRVFLPAVYANGSKLASTPPGMAFEMLESVRKSLSPQSVLSGSCVNGVFSTYCIY